MIEERRLHTRHRDSDTGRPGRRLRRGLRNLKRARIKARANTQHSEAGPGTRTTRTGTDRLGLNSFGCGGCGHCPLSPEAGRRPGRGRLTEPVTVNGGSHGPCLKSLSLLWPDLVRVHPGRPAAHRAAMGWDEVLRAPADRRCCDYRGRGSDSESSFRITMYPSVCPIMRPP